MPFPLLEVFGLVGKVIDRAIPDPKIKADLQLELAKLADEANTREHQEMMGQIGVNTEEAKNSNMFVAGWRPFVGWTGGIGLAYSFIVNPMASWVAKVMCHYTGAFPELDSGQLMTLVMGMLGFGGLRTYEKYKGVPDGNPLGVATVGSVPVTPIASPTQVLPQPKKHFLGIKQWPF